MKQNKPLVLIVEDQKINRDILMHILQGNYELIEAHNGAEAIEIMKVNHNINAVLLDIVMPIMDGYTFLSTLDDAVLSSTPIIAVTATKDSEAEQKALELGAWDFISKPYEPKVLMTRLKNVIIRSKFYMISRMKHVYEHDLLTDLYQRAIFFSETQKIISDNTNIKFALIRLDIDNFHLLNSFWGEQEGDRFLRFIADRIRKCAFLISPSVYGRINADVFCMCIPYDENNINNLVKKLTSELQDYNRNYQIKPSFGVYVIEDASEKTEEIYECATLAAKECKGKFDEYVSRYKPELRRNIAVEQQIISEMQNALDEKQFEVFLQPKYNLETDMPYGAEALVRWRHPQKGLISPGVFIPVFERNGFIGKIDYYMWESVCKLLRKWIDDGKEPAPISVNVSRVNMYNPNLVSLFTELIKKYNIEPRLLNLELTESAYMEDPNLMKKTVCALQNAGFTVMMDDFGSGYSSLNTLKDIHVDILKVDMKFLSKDSSGERGKCILTTIIRMAGWLEMPVIMEGAETAEQVNFLKSTGCEYVQGYYYARPMPVDEYENLINKTKQISSKSCSENHDELIKTIWTDDSFNNMLFNSIKHPSAIFEYDGIDFRAIRMNSYFSKFFGYGAKSLDSSEKMHTLTTDEEFKKLTDAFKNAAENKTDVFCSYNISHCNCCQNIGISLQYWGKNKNSAILFAIFDINESQSLYQ